VLDLTCETPQLRSDLPRSTYLTSQYARHVAQLYLQMSTPTIVLVPGAWHSLESYSDVVAVLSKHGYPSVSLPLPSVGATPPHNDFTGNLEGIRSCLTQLVSEEKEVVLVTHSFTSVAGQQAAQGLSKKERTERGLKGGLIRFVVINGVIVPEGFEFVAKGGYSRFPEWMNIDIEVRLPNGKHDPI
jgi:pimeloyl-ACP methyl ester carboxylesterase